MNFDDRTCVRKKLISYPEVVDERSGRPVGRVLDLSPRGLCLISRNDRDQAGVGRFRMILKAGDSEATAITFEATPVWSGKDRNPDYATTGYRITGINSRDEQALTRLLRRWSMHD